MVKTTIKTIKKTDVLIIGGGVAGTMAAIAAAREGVKVTLIERGGCLGGMWTSGLVGITLDGGNKEGILREFLDSVEQEKKISGATIFEIQKYLLEKMCNEAGVEVCLHSQVYDVTKQNDIITMIHVITKSGQVSYEPKVVIDSTGDGDVAVMAGCEFDYGRDSDHKAQPMSMIALVSGIDEKAKDYISYPNEPFWDARNRFKGAMDMAGAKYSIGCPSLQPLINDIYILSANQVYEKSGCDVTDLSEATQSARREIYEMVRQLKNNGPECFRNIALVTTPECIGVRETRRIKGKYTVTVEDMIEGKTHEDAVCRVNYWVDIHSLEDDGGKGFTDEGITTKPYDIPLGALQPLGVDNLIVAGRCISGDFYAHASYRVMGNMAPVGEAAGKLAARYIS